MFPKGTAVGELSSVGRNFQQDTHPHFGNQEEPVKAKKESLIIKIIKSKLY